MYYRQAPREPSGCLDSLLIIRIIIGIVFVPTMIFIGAVIAIIGMFYALQIHPLLGLAVLLSCIGLIVGVARWESRRIDKQSRPPGD